MPFRRSGSDERRRRVLRDERVAGDTMGGAPPTSQPDATSSPLVTYPPGAVTESQLRVTDLLPTRLITLSGLIGTLLAAVVGLFALHGHLALAVRLKGNSLWKACDPAQPGSAASWLAAAMLSAAAAASLLVYAVRRHRVDDYRGRYRFWLWMAMALTVASLDAVCRLHIAAGEFLALAARTRFDADPTTCWMAGCGLIGLVFGIRLAVEIRRAWSALALLLLAAAAFGAAAASRVLIPTVADPLLLEMLAGSLPLLGHLCVLGAILLFGRREYLTARARTPRAARRRSIRASRSRTLVSAAPTSRPESAAQRVEPGHAVRDTVPLRTPAGSANASSPAGSANRVGTAGPLAGRFSASTPVNARPSRPDRDLEDDTDDAPERLSRAERKRLKKLHRRAG